jgi:hypothetical protein
VDPATRMAQTVGNRSIPMVLRRVRRSYQMSYVSANHSAALFPYEIVEGKKRCGKDVDHFAIPLSVSSDY